MRFVSRIYAHSSMVYVTYTIDKCAHVREMERTYKLHMHNIRSLNQWTSSIKLPYWFT